MKRLFDSPVIDPRLLLLFFGITLACRFVPGALGIAYFALAIHAVRGPRQAIEALTLLFLLNLGNRAVFLGGVSAAMRWLVMLLALAGVLLGGYERRRAGWASMPAVCLFVFCIMLFPTSIITSKTPLVSTLKLISFAMGAFAIMLGFQRTGHYKTYWKVWFTSFFLYMVLSSALIYGLGMGYERNNLGFQGILSHPQVTGSIMAISAAWFSALLLFGRDRSRWLWLGAALSWAFIFMSQARTGAVAAAGGFALSFLIYLFLRRPIPYSGRLVKWGFGISLALVVLMLLIPGRLINMAMGFLQKDSEAANVASAFEESRGALIQRSLDNFYRFPALGIGLGTPTDFERMQFGSAETVMGLPTKASVEKGFLPSAMLEEIGLLGTSLTLGILFALFFPLSRYGDILFLWLALSSLFINGGEAVFYSFGGKGLFMWLMFGFAWNSLIADPHTYAST